MTQDILSKNEKLFEQDYIQVQFEEQGTDYYQLYETIKSKVMNDLNDPGGRFLIIGNNLFQKNLIELV